LNPFHLATRFEDAKKYLDWPAAGVVIHNQQDFLRSADRQRGDQQPLDRLFLSWRLIANGILGEIPDFLHGTFAVHERQKMVR